MHGAAEFLGGGGGLGGHCGGFGVLSGERVCWLLGFGVGREFALAKSRSNTQSS